MEPINYIRDVQSPFQAALAGYQGGAAIRNDQLQQQQQAVQMQQAQAQRQALQALMSNPNPTPQDYANATLAVPGMREHFKQAAELRGAAQAQGDLGHVSQVYAALSQDKPDVAIQLLRDRSAALRNSGREDDAKHLDVMAGIAEQSPQMARTMAGLYLSSVPGGDKVISGAATLEKLPGEVRKGNAEATITEAKANNSERTEGAAADKAVNEAAITGAQADNAPALYGAQAAKAGSEATTAAVTAKYAEPTAKADLALKGLQGQNIRSEISDRTKRFGLDSDKFQTETKIKLLELQNKLGELPEPVAKEVNSATIDSIAAQNSAAKMTDLADQLDKAGGGYGGLSSAAEWLKRATGNQNEMTRLRSEYSRIVTPAAMGAYKQVASGSTSDRDIETAMKGVPSDTADSATMASFLRGVAKLQTYDSVLKNAQAEWQGAVHSLGKTRSDIEIDGVKVPKGTTFKEFSDQYVPRKIGKIGKAPVTATNPTTGQKIKLVNGQWVPA